MTARRTPSASSSLMGSGAETVRDTAAALRASGEKVGVLQVRLFRPFADAAFLAALPPDRARDRRAGADQGARRAGEPLYLDVVATLAQAVATGKRGHAARHRRPLRPVVEGLHRRRWRRRCSTNWQSRSRGTASPSASTTMSHTPASLPIRRFRSIRPTWSARCSTASAPTARSAPTRTRVKIIAEDAGLLRAGLFRLRLAQIRRADDLASALRTTPIHAPYLIQQANFVACHQFQFVERHDVLRLAAPGATFLLNAPLRARRDLGPSAALDAAAHHRRQAAAVRHRRVARGRARSACAGAPTPCCRPASSRSPACCRATRRSPRSSSRSRRPTAQGRGRRRPQLPGRG